MECKYCKKLFAKNSPRQIYCSKKCNQSAYEARNPKRIKQLRLDNYSKNRERYRKYKEKWNRSDKGKKNRKEWYESHKQEIIKKNQSKPGYKDNQKNGKIARRTLLNNRPKACDECGKTKGLIDAHHIDKNRFNNHLSNLKWLCRSHHAITHIKLRNPTYQ